MGAGFTQTDGIKGAERPEAPAAPPAKKLPALQPGEISSTLSAWNEVLVRYSDRAKPELQQQVLDFTLHDRFLEELPEDGIVQRRPWPLGLFIPGSADWTKYWIEPPPPDHRYTQSWLTPPSQNPNRVDPNLGTAWAYSSVGVGTPVLETQAAIGFNFTPAVDGTYIVAPTLNVMGQYHVDIDTTAAAGGSIHEWGGVYTAVWDQATLLQPFRYAELFSHEADGLETIPVNSVPATWDGRGGPAALSIGLVGGRTYLIGVCAVVKIANTWTDTEGRPIQTLPDGSTWKVFCTMEFLQMPQVTVDKT